MSTRRGRAGLGLEPDIEFEVFTDDIRDLPEEEAEYEVVQ
jgi:hypothetical protein